MTSVLYFLPDFYILPDHVSKIFGNRLYCFNFQRSFSLFLYFSCVVCGVVSRRGLSRSCDLCAFFLQSFFIGSFISFIDCSSVAFALLKALVNTERI